MSSDSPLPNDSTAPENKPDDSNLESAAEAAEAPLAPAGGEPAAQDDTSSDVSIPKPESSESETPASPDSPAPEVPAEPVAENPSVQPPAAESDVQPTSETSAEPPAEPAAASVTTPEAVSSDAANESKPKLAPRVDESAKAIPSLAANDPMAPDHAGKGIPTQTSAPEPVEIPGKEDLDPDLEAEIAAALSQDEALAPTEPVAQAGSEAAAGDSDAPTSTEPITEESLEAGTRLKGTVQSVDAENIFVDLGFRSPGLVQARQFPEDKRPAVGDVIDVVVDKVNADEGLILVNAPRGRRKVGGNWDAVTVGQIVDCMVTKSNKGGLEVQVSNLRGFLPAGQVDVGFVSDLEPYVGTKMTVQVIEVNPRKRNLVVSRRSLLEAERAESAKHVWETLEVGQTFNGRVKTIKDYGAFIDLGGVDGFLHIGEISWSRIKHPNEVLHEGQNVDVKVISLDPERQRISLGMRQLTQNPWNLAADKYAKGTTVSGKVTRTTDFGAFVELEEGVEGLVHISELDYRRVARVTEVLNVGQEVDLQVLEVDPNRKRISLSLKATRPKPEAPAKPKDEDLAPGAGETYERKHRGPLKGGYGGGSGGGLFGNPSDFGK